MFEKQPAQAASFLEPMKRVSFLGPSGTYAEEATLAFFADAAQGPEVVERIPHPSIQGTLRSLAARQVDYAVVPIENSVEGTVSATLDALWVLPDLEVLGALVLPIRHCLISRETHLGALKAVYSHPQALAQCQSWLEENLPTAARVPTPSTTEALQHLDPGNAAIASARAASIHNLPVLARTINDYSDNCTRFWLVGDALDRPVHLEKPTCTSLAFSLRYNGPGALCEALVLFAERQINLAKLESRPTKKVIGEYLYFVDIEGAAGDEPLRSALDSLKFVVDELKIFGSYSVRHLPQV